MLGHITLTCNEDWRQPADIHAWVDQLVADYQAGAVIQQTVNPFTLRLILRRRWAGQITFGTLNIMPNKTLAEEAS